MTLHDSELNKDLFYIPAVKTRTKIVMKKIKM